MSDGEGAMSYREPATDGGDPIRTKFQHFASQCRIPRYPLARAEFGAIVYLSQHGAAMEG